MRWRHARTGSERRADPGHRLLEAPGDRIWAGRET